VKISFVENENDVGFQLSEFDPKYIPVFEMCFYTKEENKYIKSFSKDLPNLENIMTYYQQNAEAMFNQLGYFTEVPWEKAFLAFLDRVNSTNIKWWLTGSVAACIRGVPFNPHDIDIMVDHTSISEIEQVFSDVIIEPIIDTQGWLTRDFGVLFLHARIDIASDPVEALDDPEPIDCGPYAREHLEIVEWHGYKIPVPPVALQINANFRRGRKERVKLLQEYLEK
jgi:hypothetical protein